MAPSCSTRGARAELQPGYYVAVAANGPHHVGSAAFTVRSEQTVQCELSCKPCTRLMIDCRDAERIADLRVTVLVRDDGGRLVDVLRTAPGSDPADDPVLRVQTRLPVGSYQVECRASDGRTANAHLVVRSLTEPDALTVDLPRR